MAATEGGHTFRLKKISEILKLIEQERDERSDLSKKYQRSVKIINIVDSILIATTMAAGIAGIGVLSTIIAAPIVIAMEAAALGAGALSIISGQVNKKLSLKAEKHDKIKMLADAVLNTINDHISKALKDDQISDEEYALILRELEKYNNMKEELRNKSKVNIDEATKQGREGVINSFKSVFERKHKT